MRQILRAVLAVLASGAPALGLAASPKHDVIIRDGLIYDGSGKPPYTGELTIDGDRITYVGPHATGHARTEEIGRAHV